MHGKIIIGIILFFVITGLSGCTELTGIKNGHVTGQEKAELMSYTIDSWTWMDEKISDGFNHNEPVNYYKIQGKIKNKMDHIGNILIELKFYDVDNNHLGSEKIRIKSIHPSETYSFNEIIPKYVNRFDEYWNQIEKVTFSFTEY
jgi:hypothetical protein